MRAQSLVERNQLNAQLSTGPRTAVGKARSRRNSLQHGLTANPAAGTIEDAGRFKRLLAALVDELQPGSVVEQLIVHRIAVSAWRLQRAAAADSALWDTAINELPVTQHRVQQYVQEILDYWRVEVLADPDADVQRLRKEAGQAPARIWARSRLKLLDGHRLEVFMRDGCAIMAMAAIIEELLDHLRRDPRTFSPIDAEQLAWALGEDVARLPLREDKAMYPGDSWLGHQADREIMAAARRDPGEPLSASLLRCVERRLTILRTLSQTCERPITDDAIRQRRQQAPFAAETVLERLLRYETHAERSLHKNLEALAKLRGSTVQTVIARVRQRSDDGTEVEVEGQHSTTRDGP